MPLFPTCYWKGGFSLSAEIFGRAHPTSKGLSLTFTHKVIDKYLCRSQVIGKQGDDR